jgi:imidazolonepropionase-like amidohydrolase
MVLGIFVNFLSFQLSTEILGTVLVEGKSGYGLDTENEIKMLRVLERAKRELPIDISSTFCGAHAVPKYGINELSIFQLQQML